MQKIVRVREGAPLPLDEYTSTWTVIKIVDKEVDGPVDGPIVWLWVLLEQDDEDTARKQAFHNNYLAAINNWAQTCP